MVEHKGSAILKAIISALVFSVCTSACSLADHEVGGRTSTDVFGNGQLRDVADAACRGDSEGVHAIAASGVEIDAGGLDGVTPLMWALTCESVEGLRALLELGADPNKRIEREFGWTALLYATSHDNAAYLQLMLEYGGDPNTIGPDESENALSRALAFGIGAHADNLDNFYILIESGADVNHVLHSNRTIANTAIALGRDCIALDLIRNYDLEFNLNGVLRTARVRLIDTETEHFECKLELIRQLESSLTSEEWGEYLEWAEGRDFQTGPVPID